METANQEKVIEASIPTVETETNNKKKKEEETVKNMNFTFKGKRGYFKKGNKLATGRKKSKPFSIREDVITQLKKLRRKNRKEYDVIINSYIKSEKMRQFLLEIIDGKARQSVEMSGTMQNPVRIIEIKPMEESK